MKHFLLAILLFSLFLRCGGMQPFFWMWVPCSLFMMQGWLFRNSNYFHYFCGACLRITTETPARSFKQTCVCLFFSSLNKTHHIINIVQTQNFASQQFQDITHHTTTGCMVAARHDSTWESSNLSNHQIFQIFQIFKSSNYFLLVLE